MLRAEAMNTQNVLGQQNRIQHFTKPLQATIYTGCYI